MQGMISLRDMLKVMDARDSSGQPIPCTITRIKCNLREQTGGQRETLENITLAGGQFGKKVSAKNANHYNNGTRNVMVPGRSRPITIPIYTITHFNQERVYI